MKRIIAFIAVVLVLTCCFASCSQLRELGSAAAEKLSPALGKAEEFLSESGEAEDVLPSAFGEAKELLSSALGRIRDASSDSGAAEGGEAGEDSGASGGQSSATGGDDVWSLLSLGGGSGGVGASKLSSAEDVVLVPTDDYAQGYVFAYGGEEFAAYFGPYSWKVYDSYKITNHNDIVMICQALLDEHPVYGSDWESLRTADDMAYEWEQHNLAYSVLPAGSHWRDDAKDVDLDPDDQGKSFDELYESRTGQKFDLSNYLSEFGESA